jgi:hypothetical protein
MPEPAHPIHSSRRRLRLRIPARRWDHTWFDAAAAALAAQPGVEGVRLDAARAVLTLRFATSAYAARTDYEPLLAAAGISVTRPARARSHANAPQACGCAVSALRADRRTIALWIFLLLLARGLLRSGWLAPGLALLWLLWESFPALRHRLLRADSAPPG